MNFKCEINRGVAFINKRKEEEWHSDFKGQININGAYYIIDIWEKESQWGKEKYLRIKIEKNEEDI